MPAAALTPVDTGTHNIRVRDVRDHLGEALRDRDSFATALSRARKNVQRPRTERQHNEA